MWDVGPTPYGTWDGMPCGMCGGILMPVGWDAMWEVGWDAIRWDIIMGHEVGYHVGHGILQVKKVFKSPSPNFVSRKKLFHVFKNYWNNIMIYAAVNNIF